MPLSKLIPNALRLQSSAASAEALARAVIDRFVEHNRAAKVIANDLRVIGVGLRPVVDHLAFFTANIHKRAAEFTACGYAPKGSGGSMKGSCWHARVYARPGYPSVMLFEPAAGSKGCVEKWLHAFGEEVPHHLAVKVDNLENAIFYLEKQGIPFAGSALGSKDAKLRQIFASPDMKDRRPYTVLELTERHGGYEGFVEAHTCDLLKSFFGNHE
ncbi:MAG: VOC family protein [Candidatus Omnitrophota bacterium]|jgi:hypothetical protein